MVDWQADIPIQDQLHASLTMSSGTFSCTELGYPIVEKEAYAN